jgi:hypothetical protein
MGCGTDHCSGRMNNLRGLVLVQGQGSGAAILLTSHDSVTGQAESSSSCSYEYLRKYFHYQRLSHSEETSDGLDVWRRLALSVRHKLTFPNPS